MIRQIPEQVKRWTMSGPPLLLSRYLRIKGKSGNKSFTADFATARLVSCAIFRDGTRWFLYGDAYLTIDGTPLASALGTLVLDLGLIESCECYDRTDFAWNYTGHNIIHGGGSLDVRDILATVRKHIDELAEPDLDPSVTSACAAAVTVGIVHKGRPHLPVVGSGVVLSSEGLIATNRHVIEDIVGELPAANDPWHVGVLIWQQVGRETKAFLLDIRSEWSIQQVVAKSGRMRPNDSTDVAILDVGVQGIPTATLLESCSALVPGQRIVACGYPDGDSNLQDETGIRQRMPFLLAGSISALREDATGHLEQLACDLPVIPGSSGSPVFLENRAELIGIVSHQLTYTSSPTPLSLVVPVATLKEAVDETKRKTKDSKPRTTWEELKAAAKRGDTITKPLVDPPRTAGAP